MSKDADESVGIHLKRVEVLHGLDRFDKVRKLSDR